MQYDPNVVVAGIDCSLHEGVAARIAQQIHGEPGHPFLPFVVEHLD